MGEAHLPQRLGDQAVIRGVLPSPGSSGRPSRQGKEHQWSIQDVILERSLWLLFRRPSSSQDLIRNLAAYRSASSHRTVSAGCPTTLTTSSRISFSLGSTRWKCSPSQWRPSPEHRPADAADSRVADQEQAPAAEHRVADQERVQAAEHLAAGQERVQAAEHRAVGQERVPAAPGQVALVAGAAVRP